MLTVAAALNVADILDDSLGLDDLVIVWDDDVLWLGVDVVVIVTVRVIDDVAVGVTVRL